MKLRGFMALFSGVLLFSTLEVASKLMQTGGGVAGHFPFWLSFLRFFMAGAVLFFPALCRLRHRQISLTPRDIVALSGLGLVGVTLLACLYHSAITYLPANIAALVFSCNPVFVLLFAPLLLPEKNTPKKWVAAALSLTGIAVLAGDRAAGVSWIGLLLMLLTIVVFAFYTICFKKMTPRYGVLPLIAFAALIGGLFILPVALTFEGFPLASYGVTDWTGVAYLSLIGTALAYFLFIYGLSHLEAGVGSMAFFLKPFLAALFAWILLGESLSVLQLTGGAILLSGMVVILLPAKTGEPVPMD